jgi:putative ABC transport system substrate-binding protein
MKRREFITGLGGAVAWPLVASAQQSAKTYRLAQLTGGTLTSRVLLLAAFMRGLRDLGYIEGQNLAVEQRFAEGSFERLPGLMHELLVWKPDVIFVSTTPAALAAKSAQSSIPIVFVSVADPIGVGLIESLSRPGSNITGVTNIGAELVGKRLEILKEFVPAAKAVAVLINPDDQNSSSQMNSAKLAADKLGVQLSPILSIRSGADLEAAFEGAVHAHADAALRMLDPLGIILREQTVRYAAQFRLPVIYPFREDVSSGGLVSYGPNLPDQYRQAATFVHKIFTGTKPGDIPVEQPTKFETVINLRTARALGLTIPPTLLARADEVIE